jgi:antitoxin component of MazEF toxin-antitoxin module
MKTQLPEWGNRFVIRIPKPIPDAAKLRSGDALVLDVEGPGAVIVRKSRRKPNLKDLVSCITAKNRHSQTDWGELRGKEVW